MRLAILILIIISYLVISPDEIMGDSSWLAAAVAHNFLHANVFHLASNALVFWLLYGPRRKHRMLIFGLSLIIATASFAVSNGDAIGLSDALYATMGLSAPSFKSDWWKTPIAKVFVLSLLLSFLLPNVSAMTHLVSYGLGFGIVRCFDKCRRIGNDYRRAGSCNTGSTEGE